MLEPTFQPVTICSKTSDQGDFASKKITETFSHKFADHPSVPHKIIQELQTIFKGMEGTFSANRISDADLGMSTFCEFLIANGGGLESIYDLTSVDTGRYYEFCQSGFATGWKMRYESLRARLNTVINLVWHRMPAGHNPTEGYSVAASAAIREALKEEIDRIRKKKGRLIDDLKNGHVLNIDMSANSMNARAIPGFMTASRADIIKTIKYHVPKFPVEIGLNVQTESVKNLNPGQWLIKMIQVGETNAGCTARIVQKYFKSYENLCDYYFPTSYDATCILIYWALVTGWNKQVIESIGTDDLNLRFKRNRMMNAWSEDHVILRGKKTRSQPDGKPKQYTHISDKNDDYGLYNVLKDFYELTQTIRFGNDPLEARCIIMGIQHSSSTYGLFGPGVKGSLFSKFIGHKASGMTNASKFLTKHEIYDDADSPEPQKRIEKISWRQLRTSYETILEDMNLPLYVRQILLGHNSIDTTMFPYGSDKQATKTQMEMLRKTISAIHEDYSMAKFFHGAFLLPDNDPRRRLNRNQKVISIAHLDWKDNIIMFCENSRKPSWPGHNLYVEEGAECNYLAKCLFCKQCLISKETLPYLAQWEMDIIEYFEDEGEWDCDLRWLELQQAIKEAFKMWSQENDPEDISWAKAVAMRSDFLRIPLDIWHIGDGRSSSFE